MATVSTQYYTKQTVAIDLNCTASALADGAYWQSAAVDNSSDKYIDALLGGSIRVSTTSPITVGGTIEIYAYGSWDGGTTFTAGCSGTDSSYTADGEEGLLRLVETIVVDATLTADYVFGPISMAGVFGGTLPVKWGIVVANNTGQSLDGTLTNHKVEYQGIKFDSA